jgi:hypothetical protein
MFQVFSFDGLSEWIYVECDNKYIARALLYIQYRHIKDITYIGEYENVDSLDVPTNFHLDGYYKEYVDDFIRDYGFYI